MTTSLATVIFLPLLAQAADKRNVVGWVTQCNGAWEDHTTAGHPVKIVCAGARDELWFPLVRDSKVILTSPKPKQWINIRIARSGEKRHFDCDKPGACVPPPLPFAQYVSNEETGSALQAFFESPGKAYARVRLLLSKSESDESGRVTTDHAVIADDAPIKLRDLLRSTAPSGDYLLELCPFDEKNGCPVGGKPIAIKWAPSSSATWPHLLRSGLYEIVLSKVVNGVTIRTPDRGFLLIVPERNAAQARETVRAGEQMFLRNWHDPSEGRLMFEALMVDLASRKQ